MGACYNGPAPKDEAVAIEAANSIILYNSASSDAKPLAKQLAVKLGSVHPLQSTEDGEVALGPSVPDVLITVGGDGTLLRAARLGADVTSDSSA